MHYLIDQFMSDPFQCRGRRNQLQLNRSRDKLRYTAPDGTVFIIDCSDAGTSFPPPIFSPAADGYPSGHRTHTFGNGRICLAASIAGWELDRILLYCDSWAKGFCIYKRTGLFPSDPREVFTTRM